MGCAKRVKIDNNRLKKLLRGLVDIYSPSGKEVEILEYAEQCLVSSGMNVMRQEVDEARYNLIVSPEGITPEILFLGHLDTVPAFDLEKFESCQRKDEIFGLGAADMKGGCAAMIEAFISFYEKNDSLPPAVLALVVGEEEEGDGTKQLIDDLRIPWAIVGEPTNMEVCLSHYGYIEVEFRTFGKRRHASYSDYQHNAIFDMLQILLRVTAWLDKSRHHVIYNIRDVHSADSGFAVPDRCIALLDMHFPPGSRLKTVARSIERIIAAQGELGVGYKHIVDFPTVNRGYKIPDKGKMVRLIRKSFENRGFSWEPGSFRSHSDANILWEAGTKPVILGPGHLAKAHSNNESVPLKQVFLAAEVYLEILEAL